MTDWRLALDKIILAPGLLHTTIEGGGWSLCARARCNIHIPTYTQPPFLELLIHVETYPASNGAS